MKHGIALALIIFCFSQWVKCQLLELHFSANYGLPQYDSFFDVGFEARPGATLRIRKIGADRLRLGGSAEYQRFSRLIDNPIDIDDARLYSFCFSGGYDLIPDRKDRFEPVFEGGFHYFRYDEGAFSGNGFGLNFGLQYCYMVEEQYGVEIAVLLKNVFARFGGEANPNTNRLTQLFQIRLGVSIDLLLRS